MKIYHPIFGMCLTAFLTACGGGGGGSSAPTTTLLSANQSNFEATTVKDSYVTFDWFVPSTNVAPTNGTHFFYSSGHSALASPSAGPQTNTGLTTNLTATLALPNLTQRSVDRSVKSGVIYARSGVDKQIWAYQGSDILLTSYANDGLTTMYTTIYDSWSAPIPLSGPINGTTILKSFLGFSRLNTPLNFDFTKSWLAGAAYSTRKAYRQADTLFAYDWPGTGTTYGANVTPYSGTETTIENYFNSAAILAAGGDTLDGVAYAISDGAITTIEGVRAWVATSKRPTSVAPTDNYAALFQLNGKIYFGGLQKAGTRFKSIDGIDATIVNDYFIRLNSNAADSIKQTVRF